MKKFQDERKKIVNIKLGKFKHPTPIAIYEPVVNKEEADIFLFIQGHGGNIPFVDIMNHNFYDGKYLITYEKMAHGENKNVASHMPNQYVKELGYVIDEIKKMFPKKRIFLLGESWGAALGMIYYYKNPKKINGLFAWNMPRYVKDVGNSNFKYKTIAGFKMSWTILTSAQTWDRIPSKGVPAQLSSNTFLVRMVNLATAGKPGNNKVTCAAWWTFPKSWKILNKNVNNSDLNFLYIQSGEDRMQTMKYWNKFYNKNKNSPHLKYMEKGWHVLGMEEPQNDELYKLIDDYVSKIK